MARLGKASPPSTWAIAGCGISEMLTTGDRASGGSLGARRRPSFSDYQVTGSWAGLQIRLPLIQGSS